MTHPAIEAAKEALKKVVLDYGECGQAPEYGIAPCRCAYCLAVPALRAIEEAERGARGPFCIEYEERDGHRLTIRDAAGEERRWLLLPWPGEERK